MLTNSSKRLAVEQVAVTRGTLPLTLQSLDQFPNSLFLSLSLSFPILRPRTDNQYPCALHTEAVETGSAGTVPSQDSHSSSCLYFVGEKKAEHIWYLYKYTHIKLQSCNTAL